MPPTAGPATSESWNAIERWASALTRISCGTSEGVSARPAGAPIALAHPVSSASPKNGRTLPAPRNGHDEEGRGDERVDDDRERVEAPARESVGEVARRNREQKQRQELGEPDEPEVERILANRVHLPPDGDRRHRHREARGDERHPEEREVAVPERGSLRRGLTTGEALCGSRLVGRRLGSS